MNYTDNIKIIIAVFSFIILGSTGSASGITSNGGKIITYQNNPWFVNRTQFTYCVEKSENYTLEYEKALFEVEYALKDWQKTLYQIQNSPSSSSENHPYWFSKKFVRVNNCSDEVDLRILLGVFTDDVTKDLSGSGNGFVAYAKRTHFDMKTGWSKGYIWIAPDIGAQSYKNGNKPSWNRGHFTYLILLHELGHVFGFQHDDVSFMSNGWPERIADRFMFTSPGDDLNIYSLPEGYTLHTTKQILFKSYVSQSIRSCSVQYQSFITPPGSEIAEYEKLVKRFVHSFFNFPEGRLNQSEPVICLEPKIIEKEQSNTEGRDAKKVWNVALYSGHPFNPETQFIAEVNLPEPRYSVGSPLVMARYKKGDLWEKYNLAMKYQIEGAKYTSVVNGTSYFYEVRSSDHKVVLAFVFEGQIVNLVFQLHDADVIDKNR